jgi:ADP-ribose pyrophosphatase YjhB (NUDIX family)
MPSYYLDERAPQPNTARRTGVTALVERDGEILVERRADDAEVWAFVGGRIEDEERILDALHREVQEETGLSVADARLLGLFSDPTRVVEYPDGTICRILSIAFRVTPASAAAPVPSEESAEMRFVSLEELARLPFWAAHVPIRDALLVDPAEPVVA